MSNSSDDSRKREIGFPSHSFSFPLSRWIFRTLAVSSRGLPLLPWMDRSESSPAATKYRKIRSPRNGSLNIGHRGGGARIPDTSTRISTDSGIIPLAWPVVYIGHRLASERKQAAATGSIGWNVWHERDNNNRSRPVQYVIASIYRFADGRRDEGESRSQMRVNRL